MLLTSQDKTYRQVAMETKLYQRFKKFYPDKGDFRAVMVKLLRRHVEDLEQRKQNGQQTFDPIPPAA
jgi:hypothetical protein